MTIQKTSEDGGHASLEGAVSVRLHAKIDHGDPEIDALNLGELAADVAESHRKQAENEAFASKNNGGPTICISTGYYSFHDQTDNEEYERPMWSARLGCGSCKYRQVNDSLAQLKNNIPDGCQADPQDPACPMFRGMLKRQYERRA